MSQGGLLAKIFKGKYKPKLEFPEGLVERGEFQTKKLSMGGVWIFLEQLNLPFKTGERLRLRLLGRVLRL